MVLRVASDLGFMAVGGPPGQSLVTSGSAALLKQAAIPRAAVMEAKKNFEVKMARNIRNDKKSFFSYVGSKRKLKAAGVGPLIGRDGLVTAEAEVMSQIFNEKFAEVFTAEDQTNPIPLLESRVAEGKTLSEISILF